MVKKFCERLRKLREDSELSQTKLGLILDLKQQAIDRWEHGITEPSMENIIRLAIVFSVTTDYLLGLTDDMNPPDKKKRSDV